MIEALIWLGVFTLVIFVFGSAAYASFSAAPWLPLRNKDHARVMKYIRGRKGKLLELGAGDARLLVDVAKQTQLHGIGFEISVIPYLVGRARLFFTGMSGTSDMVFKNFFREDFSDANVIYCFLTPHAMEKLKEKFEREVRNGTRIVSYSFKVPGWTPTIEDRENNQIPLFIYDR